MTTKQQTKGPMHAAKVSPDSGASQGARRATEDAPESAPTTPPPASDTEVVPRARRRTFTKGERRRILQEADQCTKPGELGALMRREGIYSSSLSTWRRQRDAADLDALAPKKRGPKVDLAARSDALQIAQLTRERDKLLVELSKAQLVIEVQKKVTALLDLLAADNKRGST
jgi:transposase